jgi:hypothetical protein
LGGNIVSVAMDEPLVAAKASLHETDEYAVSQTADFIVRVRRTYPGMLLGDIESFPFTSVVDHIKWLDKLSNAVRERGVRGLDFYRIDPDWNAFTNQGGWADVVKLEAACSNRHIPFSLIYWAARAPALRARGIPPTEWRNEVLQQAQSYRAAGGVSDQIVLESWIGLPTQALPETSSESFTGAVVLLESSAHHH